MLVRAPRPRGTSCAAPRSVAALLAAFLLGACGEARPPAPPPRTEAGPYAGDGTPLRPIARPARKPNLLVIVIDTLRADAAGMGPGDGVMPWLAAYGEQGVVFPQASAPAPWTVPSVTSLLTGLLPSEHGCLNEVLTPRLAESITTYAEVLRHAYGYETAAFTDAPWFRGASSSVLQGFRAGTSGSAGRPGRVIEPEEGYWLRGTPDALAPWLATRDPQQPFLLFLHTFEAHDPYGPASRAERARRAGVDLGAPSGLRPLPDLTHLPEALQRLAEFLADGPARERRLAAEGTAFMQDVARSMWAGFRDGAHAGLAVTLHHAYRDGARWVDDGLRSALGWLEAQGLLEDTLVVIASDHGEAFAEHGTVGHGHHLYDELLRVPLVFRGPPPFDRPLEHPASVGLIDVFPTFFDWAGLTELPGRRGRSLLPLIQGRASGGHPVRAEVVVSGGMTGSGVDWHMHSVRTERWKYVGVLDRAARAVREQVFDLLADPDERDDLLARLASDEVPLPEAMCREIEEVRRLLQREHLVAGELKALLGQESPDTVTVWNPPPAPCDPPR